MSLIFRTPVLIARRQPYIDWANSLGDAEAEFVGELAERRDVYLAPHHDPERSLEALLDLVWEDIFEHELLGWSTDEARWPQERTRQMFGTWFDVELAGSVIDLVEDDPLTQEEVDLADVEDALVTCAWCENDTDDEAGRVVPFEVTDPERLADREGLVLDLMVGNRVVRGVVTPTDSEPRRENVHVIFRACSRRCEKELQRRVPRALDRLMEEMPDLS